MSLSCVSISTHEDSLPDRLGYIYDEATKLFKKYQPEHIRRESVFVFQSAYRLICYSVGVLCAASLLHVTKITEARSGVGWRWVKERVAKSKMSSRQ